jgi:hypothetical protein
MACNQNKFKFEMNFHHWHILQIKFCKGNEWMHHHFVGANTTINKSTLLNYIRTNVMIINKYNLIVCRSLLYLQSDDLAVALNKFRALKSLDLSGHETTLGVLSAIFKHVLKSDPMPYWRYE